MDRVAPCWKEMRNLLLNPCTPKFEARKATGTNHQPFHLSLCKFRRETVSPDRRWYETHQKNSYPRIGYFDPRRLVTTFFCIFCLLQEVYTTTSHCWRQQQTMLGCVPRRHAHDPRYIGTIQGIVRMLPHFSVECCGSNGNVSQVHRNRQSSYNA